MSKEELIYKTNKAISELVYEKDDLRKAYNYYHCKRDKEQFKYLEENYGIGQPTEILFIPLIKKHVDALIGEYLDLPILPKVSCKDTETLNNIFREKQLKIATEYSKVLESNLRSNLLKIINKQDITDLNIKQLLDKVKEDIEENFISEYEMAGLDIVTYAIQSRNIDLQNKLRQLYLDVLITGFDFYKVEPSSSKENVQLNIYSPLDVFPDLNYDSPYIKDSYRIVVRTLLTRNQILNKYGKELSKDEREAIKDLWQDHLADLHSFYFRGVTDSCGIPATDGIRAGEEVTPVMADERWHRYDNTTLPVYEVEWKEVDKNFVEQRYSTIRIGEEIYILRGKDDKVVRTKDNPEKCSLSVNGIWFNNRTGVPYSLVKASMPILDKYDISMFYRDKLIANSGSVGDWINLPTLPAFLGDSMPERVMKWLAYKKMGVGLMDTSQEGLLNTGQAPLNTLVNGFDDTVRLQAIQAIQVVIDSLEQTESSISGVFRERLNGILQRDAVTNVQVGINNSFTVTKQWHFQMDLLLQEILLDILNCAKIVYDKGITGVLILGKLQKIFTALPKYYTLTDFDVHITTSTDIVKEMEQIKSIVPEFIKSGAVSPDIIVDILTSKSLTEMKVNVKKALRKLKEENNQMQQLVQQLEQLQNRLQEAEGQLQQAQRKISTLDEARLQIEQQKIQLQNNVDMYKAKTDRTFKENQAENDTKRTEIELLQLYDGNPYNDKIRNI